MQYIKFKHLHKRKKEGAQVQIFSEYDALAILASEITFNSFPLLAPGVYSVVGGIQDKSS